MTKSHATEYRTDPDTGKPQYRTRLLGDYSPNAWTRWFDSDEPRPPPVAPLQEDISKTDGNLPLRPSLDPQVLGEQLRQSLLLQSPPTEMRSYKGYLAQIVRDCVLAIASGDTNAPSRYLGLMAPALHQTERIHNVEPGVALEVWMVQWVLEVAIEALQKKGISKHGPTT